jgi:hypothetical protein
MKKICSILLVFSFVFFLSFPILSLAETNTSEQLDKGETADFYLTMRNLLQVYLSELENGKITEEEFAEKVKENIGSQLQTNEDVNELMESENKVMQPMGLSYDYDFGAFGVKATEIVLFAKNPIDASRAKSLAEDALKEAQDRYKDYTLWQGNGDAFRHAYWSALMTKHINRDFAYEAGYAHEGYKTGSYDDIKSLDVKMDIKNNYSGRILGTKYKSKSDNYIAEKVADEVSKGNMVRIRTYTSGKPTDYIDGVPTKYMGKFVPTSDGGRYY